MFVRGTDLAPAQGLDLGHRPKAGAKGQGMKFIELVDIHKLHALCESFTATTGAATAILDLEGNILVQTGWKDICARFHRSHPATSLRCRESDAILSERLKKGETYSIHQCKNGLIDVAAPITVAGEHVANFFTGQFLFRPPNEELFVRQAEEFGFEKRSYLEALHKVPVFSEQHVRGMMDFFTQLARLIGEMGLVKKRLEAADNEALRLNTERMSALLQLNQMAGATLHQITSFALEAALRVTRSKLGYLAFVNEEDETVSDVQLWSRGAMTECKVSPETAGLWGEAVRQRRALITNDRAIPNPWKKEMPEEPVLLTRHISLPLVVDGKIVLVAGVGNKEEDYTEADVNELTLMMEGWWRMVERKRAEDVLRDSEKKYRRIVDTAEEGIWAIGSDTLTTFVNPRMAELIGYTAAEILGRPATDFLFEEDIPDHRKKIVRRALGLSEHYERRFRRKDGQTVWTLASATPILDERRRYQGSFVMFTDITERKRMENVMRESEERFRALSEKSPAGVYLIQDDLFRYVNPAFAKIHGYAPEEIIDRFGPADFPAPEDRERVLNTVQRRMAGAIAPPHIEFRIRRKDGSSRAVEVFGSRTLLHGRPAILGTLLDITERKRAEEELRRVNRELRAISDCNQVLLRATDEQTLIDEICRIVCEEAGYRMAWVGYAEDDAAKSVRPVAWAGVEKDYLAAANISWSEDTERGRGPTGTAIRSGRSSCFQDFATDPRAAFWREGALERGYRSSIALPLKDEHGQAFGALTIYSTQPNAFPPGEIRLLEELAADLAFGITVVRVRMERDRAQEFLALKSFALSNVHEAALLTDEQARFRYVNQESCRVLGYTREELLGMGIPDIDPDFPAERWPDHWRDLKARRSLTFEGRHRAKDGRTFPVEVSANYFEYGGKAYSLALVRDITERKRAEEERLEHLRFFEAMDRVNRAIEGTKDLEQMLSDVLDAVLAILDCDRAFLLCPCDPGAAAWQVLMERAKPEYSGSIVLRQETPMDPGVAEIFRVLLTSDIPVKFGPQALHPVDKDVSKRLGIKSILSMALHPKEDKAWQFGIHQCSYARVWTQKEEKLFQEIGRRLTDALSTLLVNRKLQESARQMRTVLENVPDCIARFDKDARHLFVGPAATKMLGITQDQDIGKTPRETGRPGSDAQNAVLEDLIKQAFEEGTANSTEAEWMTTQGVRCFDILHVPEKDETGKIVSVLGIAHDITERKRNDAVNLSRLRLIQFAATHSLPELLEETLNEVEKLTGSCIGFYHFVEEDQKALTLQDWSTRTKTEFCKAKGPPLHYPIDEAGVWVDCVRQRKPVIHNDYASLAHRKGMPEGHAQVVRELVVPVFRKEKITAILGVGNKPTDYTAKDAEVVWLMADLAWEIAERKRAEEEQAKLRQHLDQARKMQAVGQLAGGIAHDFNNILAVVNGYSETVLRNPRLDETTRSQVQEVFSAGNRGASLIRQLLAFSRKQVLQPKILSLNGILEDTQKMLRRLIGEHVEIEFALDAGLDPVMADPSQMEQVILNFCINAQDAMPEGGTITVETANQTFDEAQAARHFPLEPGRYIRLSVSDTGTGMDAETVSHIFEPFFTTKGPDRGTGLGLATVYGIVTQSGGQVSVDSEPGKGSTFSVYLPAVLEQFKAREQEPVPRKSARGTETILLVEDVTALRILTRQILEDCGYKVLEAEDGERALRVAQEREAGISLLLTDVVLPKIKGPLLAKRLLQRRPGMKVLYISGCCDHEVAENGAWESGFAFLQKPFGAEELTRKVRELLDAA